MVDVSHSLLPAVSRNLIGCAGRRATKPAENQSVQAYWPYSDLRRTHATDGYELAASLLPIHSLQSALAESSAKAVRSGQKPFRRSQSQRGLAEVKLVLAHATTDTHQPALLKAKALRAGKEIGLS